MHSMAIARNSVCLNPCPFEGEIERAFNRKFVLAFAINALL